MISLTGSLLLVLLIAFVSHLFFASDILRPLPRNGINKLHVTCDGVRGEISTQRYYGFEDFAISNPKEFPDLPIISSLHCEIASLELERRADLRDRFEVTASCDDAALTSSGFDAIACPGTLSITVRRV